VGFFLADITGFAWFSGFGVCGQFSQFCNPVQEKAKLRVNPLFFAPSFEDTAISKNDFGKFLTGY
jgi:hypothetical protein